jgi:hypothetical protein
MPPLLLQDELTFVIYPYQLPTLSRKIECWNNSLSPNINRFSKSLEFLVGETPEKILERETNQKISMHPPISFYPDISRKKQLTENEQQTVWGQYNSLDEIELLLSVDDQEPDEISTSGVIGVNPLENDPSTEFYNKAWMIHFETGEKILFQLDGKVNVVMDSKSGLSSEERYVSSLREGQRILFIHGSRKQSLLDLLIERIYQHPAINLHIKMIERWQEDFSTAFYQKARSNNWGIGDLFAEMQRRGTKLTTSQPLRNWLRGETLRPHDSEDLRRIADIFNLSFLREHYKRIHRSGGRIHGLHVSLSRKLNEWIEEGGKDIYETKEDDILDAELGLTFQDFRGSISILKVKSKYQEQGLFTADMFGFVLED